MKLLFIQVGGTIDKYYPQGKDHHGFGFEIGSPAYLNILQRAGYPHEVEDFTIMKKDGLCMSDEDRELIKMKVAQSDYRYIIITHGTDSIRDTAKVLHGITEKTIVLTGAMLPEQFRDSDADFNLGMAVGAIPHLSDGVYIALDSEVRPWYLP